MSRDAPAVHEAVAPDINAPHASSAHDDRETVEALSLPAGRSPLRQMVLVSGTALVRPLMRRRARVLLEESPTRSLHLGCAYTILPGWVNVDLWGRVPADVALDVKKPLPIADGSVNAIFTEHMIEHLTYVEAFAVARECARVLKPGGLLRVVVPDFSKYVASYAGNSDLGETMTPGRLTRLVALASSVYGSSHRSIWDEETLVELLNRAGLEAEQREFGESRIQPCPDAARRKPESLYVEAVKPESPVAGSTERARTTEPA